jgi:cold shock CspA family protein
MSVTYIGTIRRWFPDRGFGFIERIGRPDLFCHRNALRIKGRPPLEPGETVEFIVQLDPDGRERAAHVRLA